MTTGEASRTTIRSDHSHAVDALFAEWDREDSPGCAVGIIHNGEIVHARGYGMASLELGVPIGTDSVFHVASVSKQFCAIAVALLAEDGKLSLDDEVRQYVPELPDLGLAFTIRQAIHHMTGLRDQYGLFRLAGWRDGDAQLNDDVLDFAYRHQRLNFPPGEQYAYCNTSYTLLALIASRVSGQSFREAVHERIFAPLDMTGSHFNDDHSEVVRNRTNAYAPRDEGGFKTQNSNVDAVGAICLFTTVDDLLKWVRNFGERSVAGAVLDEAMTSGRLNDGRATNYGFGLSLSSYRGLQTVGHGGSDSGYRAQVTWFPEADFGVVVLANVGNFKPGSLALQIADIYLTEQLGADELADAPELTLAQDELERYVGIYLHPTTNQVRRIELRDSKLFMPSGFGEDMELTAIGPDRFRIGEPPHEVRFSVNEDDELQLEELLTSERDTVYVKVEQIMPTVEELAAYVGTYYAPELGTAHRIYLRAGKLFIKQHKNAEQELTPAVADTFVMAAASLVFRRDGHGNVAGCELFNDRIRYLRFERA